ncbi:hypothetical protein ACN28S_10945 [Cystobacter fuscus]
MPDFDRAAAPLVLACTRERKLVPETCRAVDGVWGWARGDRLDR